MLGFKRALIVAVLSAAAISMTSTGVLAGGNPGRGPFPVGDLTGNFCGDAIGPILLHSAVANEYIKTYTLQDGTVKQQVNGRFVVEVIGNGHDLTFNSSGPGAVYFHPDGSILVTGYGLVFFIGIHGEGIWLYNGNVLTDATTGLILSRTGHATDVCALLAA